jgi:hypothetical protein
MRSTSAVPRVISQLEDIFRMHHPTRNNYCILHNEQCEKPRTKIFRRSYHVFPSPIEPRIRIRFRRIRSLCLQIILARLVILTIDIYTVVKELRSKMLGQHPGYFKAVFLKKTQIIIVSIYEYTVYIMF